MNKIFAAVLGCLVLSCNTTYAHNVERFFPKAEFGGYRNIDLRIPPLPGAPTYEPTVEEHNRGAELNNLGVNYMRSNDFTSAEEAFREASRLMPAEPMLRNNMVMALDKIPGRKQEAIEQLRILMALEPENFRHPFNAGIIYLNDLKDPRMSAAYLKKAFELAPDEIAVIKAYIMALDSTGEYDDSVFSLMEEHAVKDSSGTLLYNLGLRYLERKDFNRAISSLDSARKRLNSIEGEYAYIRARFCAGQLSGLAGECKTALRSYSGSKVSKQIKNFLRYLTPQDYRFEENILIKLKNASKFEEAEIIYHKIPNVEGHQVAAAIGVKVSSRGNMYNLELEDTDEPDIKKISLTKDMLGSVIKLKIISRIKVKPTINACYKGSYPNFEFDSYDGDKLLCMNDPSLNALYRRLLRQEGGYVPNAVLAIGRGLDYRENGIEYPVSWIFKNPSYCDCSEFSLLLTALCLKNRMPSRMVHGFLVKTDNWNVETNIGHAWCEIYSKGNGWIPVDPTACEGVDWAYCGNLLSDQIVFCYKNNEKDVPRVSIQYVAEKFSGIDIDMSASYKISNWRR